MAPALRFLPAVRLAAVPQTRLWRVGARRAFSAQSACMFVAAESNITNLSSDGQEVHEVT